ncbi:juvenile hormone esterase-like [Penaeus japonicus]|uniref:juvenile hormone esterase-like n=1 Tax=Penaeus japonicus TaxID=27405 RepID=UPI001C711076|nr:juvenile hormone esterase-like [Penaeus japonicus]
MASLRILPIAAAILAWAMQTVGGVGVERPVVSLPSGKLAGIEERSTKGRPFYSFYSIPFAKPPLGRLRFRDPEPSEGWAGERDASRAPPPRVQIPFAVTETGNATVLGREDCLFLSVFTRRPNALGARLPVMVYIHGGGYFAGSTSKYPPHVLLNEDIVLVSLQYRLGIMGFLSTEDSVIPGNFGLKDQALGLRWTKENIRFFGGDETRITVFGVSAGAASAHFQVLSPATEGLFHRAILQSGAAVCPWSLGRAHREAAHRIAAHLGCPAHEGSLRLLECLQGVAAEEVVGTLTGFFEFLHVPLVMGPRVDGDFLPDDPEVLLKEGRHKEVDLISGITAHDGGLFAFGLYGNQERLEHFRRHFPSSGSVALDFHPEDDAPLDLTRKVFEFYLGDAEVGVGNADQVVKMFTDRTFSVCHDLTTMYHSRGDQHRSFAYEFNHRGDHSLGNAFEVPFARHWITHADDMFYLFTGGDTWQPLTSSEDLAVRDIMTALWVNFAATGDPTPDDSLGFRWAAVNETQMHYLSLTPTPSMQDYSRSQVREFFASLPTRQNRLLRAKETPGDPKEGIRRQEYVNHMAKEEL